ncbi:MAG TPA: hypothetical protein PKI11_11465, partial [Candidatus Hydrogenedentes bacterium]|nr:hypothetical protein [Candidatus Hydrogenedentota bacterium]
MRTHTGEVSAVVRRAAGLVLGLIAAASASFAAAQTTYTLTVEVVGSGTTSPPAGEHTYPEGQAVFLSAFPNTDWAFDRWEGDLTGTEPSNRYLLMDSDKTVTAVFAEGGYLLTIAVVGDG